jgi:hypothetical protein
VTRIIRCKNLSTVSTTTSSNNHGRHHEARYIRGIADHAIYMMGGGTLATRAFTAFASSALAVFFLLTLTVTSTLAQPPLDSTPPPSILTKATPTRAFTDEQLDRMPLWPPVKIRAILNGTSPDQGKDGEGAPSVDLLFVVQAGPGRYCT